MASNVDITPGMTTQAIDLTKRDLAINAYNSTGPKANLKRLEGAAAAGTGQRVASALGQGQGKMNTLAYVQEGGEQQDRTVALGKDQAIADGFGNQFKMLDEVKAGEKAATGEVNEAKNNISAKSNNIHAMGYYTDSDEKELQGYIHGQIAHLPYADQYEIWMSYSEEMFDGDGVITASMRAKSAFLAKYGPDPSQESSPTAAV